MNKPSVRSSTLPLLMSCSNAVLNPDSLQFVETENEPAVLGTLIHSMAEDLVKTGDYDLTVWKDRLTKEEYDRAGKLMRNFLVVWRSSAAYMKHPKTEVALKAEMPLITLTGHIDLLSMGAEEAFVIDYKAGRQHEDHFHQMAGYAYLVWDRAGRPKTYRVFVSVVYLEDLSIHPYHFTVPMLQKWEAEMTEQIKVVRYTVGRKCAGCPLHNSCPAYSSYTIGAVAALSQGAIGWEGMTPEERGQLIDRMYVIEKAVDQAKANLRDLVREKGSVDIGKGYEQVLVEDRIKFLDSPRSLPVLEKRLKPAELASVMRLPLDDVLNTFAKRATKGTKIQAREHLLSELDAAGAVVKYSTTKMWRRPKGEKVLK